MLARLRFIFVLVFLGFPALVAGCTMNVPLSPEVTAARDHRIDRFVGLYFPEETATYTWRESRYGDQYVFPLGPPSVRAIEEAARRTFARTARVNQLPPLPAGSPDVDAVLEARIEDFSFVLPLLKTSTYSAEIAYRFTLHSPTGAPVASWRVVGEGAQAGQIGFEYARWPGEATDLAIADAMRNFVERIDVEPEVTRWLRDSRGADAAVGGGS